MDQRGSLQCGELQLAGAHLQTISILIDPGRTAIEFQGSMQRFSSPLRCKAKGSWVLRAAVDGVWYNTQGPSDVMGEAVAQAGGEGGWTGESEVMEFMGRPLLFFFCEDSLVERRGYFSLAGCGAAFLRDGRPRWRDPQLEGEQRSG